MIRASVNNIEQAVMSAACVCIVVMAACSPLPPATPSPAELPGLRDRVERDRADTESVVRLAAGLWRSGDRAAARQLLAEAARDVPDAPEYLAALAVTAETDGDFYAAREWYLRFLQAAGWSNLSRSVAGRPYLMRGVTAEPLAAQLVDGDLTLDHGSDPALVVAVPRFQAAPGDPDMQGFAILATELLVRDLGARGLVPLDWELSEAVRQRVAADPAQEAVAARVAEHLDARVVVTGTVQRSGPDSVSLELRALRFDDLGVGTETVDILTLGLSPYAPDRSRLATRAFEMAVGAEAGTTTPPQLDVADFVSRAALMQFAAGLLLVDAGSPLARDALAAAAQLAPNYPPIEERIDQIDELAVFQGSETLPLAREILAFARSAQHVRVTIGRAEGRWLAPDPLERSGIGEVLGLDRVGAQVFLDLLISVGGPS